MGMDEELDKISQGLSPELIQFKSQEYQEEFERFKAELLEKNEGWLSDNDEGDEIAFRSFVMHKVAALDVVLQYVVGFLNGDEEE